MLAFTMCSITCLLPVMPSAASRSSAGECPLCANTDIQHRANYRIRYRICSISNTISYTITVYDIVFDITTGCDTRIVFGVSHAFTSLASCSDIPGGIGPSKGIVGTPGTVGTLGPVLGTESHISAPILYAISNTILRTLQKDALC